MDNNALNQVLSEKMVNYRLPRYNELPDVGLYLEQTVRLINGYLEPLGDMKLTSSMISNYVKSHLIINPVKKCYYREHLAGLITIALAKTVLPLEDIRRALELQKENYSSEVAYDYFCTEFENALKAVLDGSEPQMNPGTSDRNQELKQLVYYMVTTIAHRIHLEGFFQNIFCRDES